MSKLNNNDLVTRRFFIGFDPFMEGYTSALNGSNDKYPPHDIVKVSDTQYQLALAIAGFAKEDIEIKVEKNRLTISGSKTKEEVEYLYKGISTRSFSRNFVINDDVKVGSAKYEDGIITINLERVVPKKDLPRLIALE